MIEIVFDERESRKYVIVVFGTVFGKLVCYNVLMIEILFVDLMVMVLYMFFIKVFV